MTQSNCHKPRIWCSFLALFSTLNVTTTLAVELPFFAEEARAAGAELPLPYGLSFGVVINDDVTTADNLTYLLVGDSAQAVDTVTLGDSSSNTEVIHIRADVWLLPFLNVYAIGGYLEGSATTDMSIDMPGFIPDITTEIDQDYHGDLWGVGTTWVYGVDRWVASLDVNYTRANLNLVDSEIESLLISPRIGYRFLWRDYPVTIMAGGSYLDLSQTITVTQPALGGIPAIETQMDIDTEKNWNTTLTLQAQLSRQWELVVEAGFANRETITAQFTRRF